MHVQEGGGAVMNEKYRWIAMQLRRSSFLLSLRAERAVWEGVVEQLLRYRYGAPAPFIKRLLTGIITGRRVGTGESIYLQHRCIICHVGRTSRYA